MTEKQKWFLNHNSMDFGLLLKKGEEREHENKRFLTTNCTDILDAWQETAYYPQTSAGLNHTRRDVVVADYDGNCKSFLKSFSGKVFPSYILINPESNHVQAGWLLDEPYDFDNPSDHVTFLNIKRSINAMCPDGGFTGWQIKNPFYEGFIPYHFLMNKYSKSEIEKNFLIKNSNQKNVKQIKTSDASSLKFIDNKETQKVKKKTIKTDRTFAGRNEASLYFATRFVSKCKTENIEYDQNTVVSFLQNKQLEICELVHKSAPLPDKEICTVTRQAIKYVELNYNPILAKNGRFNDQARKASLITRRANAEARAELTWKYHQEGLSLRAIAKIMEIGKNTVSKDLEFMKSKLSI